MAANQTNMQWWFRFNMAAQGSGNGTTEEEDTSFPAVYPDHQLFTTYTYNSLNQVVQQVTPDGGLSKFWYDRLGRLVVSQNARQLSSGDYSYTLYDVLGRITEVGKKQVSTGANLPDPGFVEESVLSAFQSSGTNSQMTQTYYEAPNSSF